MCYNIKVSAVRLDGSTRSIYSSTFYFKKYNVSEGKKLYISLNFNWIIFLLFSAFFIFFFFFKKKYITLFRSASVSPRVSSPKSTDNNFSIFTFRFTHTAQLRSLASHSLAPFSNELNFKKSFKCNDWPSGVDGHVTWRWTRWFHRVGQSRRWPIWSIVAYFNGNLLPRSDYWAPVVGSRS